ncbi:hypothetical protein [Methylobacterium fujisawaense]|uniref:hypothetical protein n=1 Tax=Methylobacterium fujisawaense TaxID=107400 RepID=UPI002F3545A8
MDSSIDPMSAPSSSRTTGGEGIAAKRYSLDDTVEFRSMRPIQLHVRNVDSLAGPDGRKITFLGPHSHAESDRISVPFGVDDDPNAVSYPDPILALDRLLKPPPIPDGNDRKRAPCNLFIVKSTGALRNSRFLDTIYGLFGLLDAPQEGIFADGGPIRRRATAQFDLLVELRIGDAIRLVIFSIWFGQEAPLVDWARTCAQDRPWQAAEWACLGFMADRRLPVEASNPLGQCICRAVRLHQSIGTLYPGQELTSGDDLDPPELKAFSNPSAELLQPVPSALLFGWDLKRAVANPCYSPAKYRVLDGPPFQHISARWTKLIDPGMWRSREAALDFRLTLELGSRSEKSLSRYATVVEKLRSKALGYKEPIEALASLEPDERTLIAMPVETMLNMTRATLLLIDGFDRAIGPVLYRSGVSSLKKLAIAFPGLTIIVTTQDFELISSLDHLSHEVGLVKGGEILDPLAYA